MTGPARRTAAIGALILGAALGLSGCASHGPTPAAPVDHGFPRSFEAGRAGLPGSILVRAIHRDGTAAFGSHVRLSRLERGLFRQGGRPVPVDVNGIATFTELDPGRYRVALETAPAVERGWLRWGANAAHGVSFAVAPDERIGHTARLVVPRAGVLRVVVDRAGLATDERLTVSVRRVYPNGQVRPRHDSAKAGNETQTATRHASIFVYRALPEGRYSVRVNVMERRTSTAATVAVHAGETNVARLAVGPPGVPVRITYDGPRVDAAGKAVRHVVWINPLDGSMDVMHGDGEQHFDTPQTVLTSRGGRPGPYVAILPRLQAARVTAVTAPEHHVHLAPPAFVHPVPGGATVRVTVAVGGDPITGAFLALAPAADRHLFDGEWMRTRTGGGTTFEGVPPGDWDVLVIDRAWGQILGLPNSPTIHRIHIPPKRPGRNYQPAPTRN